MFRDILIKNFSIALDHRNVRLVLIIFNMLFILCAIFIITGATAPEGTRQPFVLCNKKF